MAALRCSSAAGPHAHFGASSSSPLPAPRAPCRTPLAQPGARQGRRALHVVRVADIGEAGFSEHVLQSSTPVLVDFWASWCGPCKLMAPLMDWAEKEYDGKLKVVKVEHDGNPKLIAQYKVYGLPTLMVFKDGQEVPGSKREGAFTKPLLIKYLDKVGISK